MKLSELIKIVCFQILLVGAMLSPVFAVTAPAINPIPRDIDGNYTVSWSAASSSAGIKNYILQESSSLEGCLSFSDGAEEGLVNWNSNNFTQSLAASSSGSFSFYSGNGNNLSNYLRTVNSILVSSEAILKFKIKYWIESNYDYLRVQVSSDGNNWATLESYSGTENSFVQKSISLASYEGQSIYLRFLYTTDSSVVCSGTYIDEIAVISYPSFASIGGNVTTTFYNVTGKPTGRYYYRVKAVDSVDIQSCYSEIISVEVGPDITAPDAPNISASASSVVHGNNVGLTWNTPSDESSIAAYELQEKIVLPSSEASFQDNAEVGLSKWVNSGFSCSTARWHGGSYSFFSGSANSLNNTLTLRNPIHLESSPELSFWAYYSLENSCDKVDLQLSTDNITWTTLETYTGYQNYWLYETCNLSAYAGRDIYIRFKYTTDNSVASIGFYFDDFEVRSEETAISTFWTTLSGSITDNCYTILGRDVGSYSYRVRAEDSAGNWGDYSVPCSVAVTYSSGPDLSVQEPDIQFSPERCAEGDTLMVKVKVRNLGPSNISSALSLYYNALDSGHYIANQSVSLPALSVQEYSFSFSTRNMGKDPLIYAVLSGGSVDINSTNNSASKRVSIMAMIRPTFCYPSPFNPANQSTKIVYRLDGDQQTRIVMFDRTGRVVWQKTNSLGLSGGQNGLNEVPWNGITDFGEIADNGIYIYKILDLSSKTTLFTGKVMVLR